MLPMYHFWSNTAAMYCPGIYWFMLESSLSSPTRVPVVSVEIRYMQSSPLALGIKQWWFLIPEIFLDEPKWASRSALFLPHDSLIQKDFVLFMWMSAHWNSWWGAKMWSFVPDYRLAVPSVPPHRDLPCLVATKCHSADNPVSLLWCRRFSKFFKFTLVNFYAIFMLAFIRSLSSSHSIANTNVMWKVQPLFGDYYKQLFLHPKTKTPLSF